MEGATPRLINYERKLVVVYCYRPTGSAQTHAISIELRHQNEQLAFIEPIHCWGLRQTQINLWLHQALSKLSRTYRLDARDLICSFTLDPSECPLQPCPPSPVFSDEEEQVTLTREEIRYGGWCNIWAYQRFYASLLATYAGISDEDAIELLYQLEEAGYVQLGSQVRDLLPVKSHTFVFDNRRKIYTPSCEKGSTPSEKQIQDSESQTTHNFTSYRKIWRTVRYLRIFKVQAISVCTEVSLSITERYLNRLHQMGYFQVLQAPLADLDDEAESYLLTRDSGAIAPLVCKSGVVCDLNNPPTIYKPD